MILKTFEIDSIEELSPIVELIESLLEKYPVIVFDGEMGAGKTTLIGKVCTALGITEVSSPTYAIVNEYLSTKNESVYHFDFYRIENEQEAVQSGLDEYIDSGNICFIEWASNIPKLLPSNYVKVSIAMHNGSHRRISIETL